MTNEPREEADAVAAALRGLLELIGVDDSEAAWRDATAVGWEALAAAQAPTAPTTGAGGEALEAARVAELEAALREILAELHQSEHTRHFTDTGAPTTARTAYDIARRALAPSAEEGGE